MIIYIIKHPQTEYNKKGIIQGHKDSALTKEGEKTAEKLGRVLKDKNITRIYSSDLGRCLQTSEIINKFLQVQITPTNNLRERNFGKLNGKPILFIKKLLDLKDANIISPGGESFNQMKDRVLLFIKSLLLKKEDGPILLVTHEGCVRAILSDCYKTMFTSSKCDTNLNWIGVFNVEKEGISLLKFIKKIK